MNKKNILLACESSCDDLSFCLYDIDNDCVIVMKTLTQKEHRLFGGVVPDIASKEHLKYVDIYLNELLKEVDIRLHDINYFAVTKGPGLPGALLVGYSFMKSLAWFFKKPFISVNHLEGHIYSSLLEHEVLFPHICLSVSGGHTSLYYVKNENEYTLLGKTQDDAAGECFDKVAKMLGHTSFPGGPLIEEYAQKNNFMDTRKYPRLAFKGCDFSFSGLKTAVLYDLVNQGCYSLSEKKVLLTALTDEIKYNVASSLLCAIKDIFLQRIDYAMRHNHDIKAITFVGGVSCNEYLRREMEMVIMRKYAIPFIPCKKKYSTDNAAMIAKRASLLLKNSRDDKAFLDYSGDIEV